KALRRQLKAFVSLCEQRGELLGLLVENATQLRAAQLDLYGLGSEHPSLDLIYTYGALADRTMLTLLPWGRALTDALGSNEKRNWRGLAAQWSANIERNQIEPLLGAEQTDEKT